MTDTSAPTPAALLAHATWVRRLATRLMRDAAAADDVAQDALLSALEHPPRTATRSWFGAVTRNIARKHARGAGRRARREEEVARSESQADPAELVERAALQQEVVEHVLALDDPYREVILLRFFEDQDVTSIARRTGRAPSTVRTQQARALALLRERLEREHGEERWAVALMPLVDRVSPAAAAIPLGVVLPLLGAAVLTTGCALWLRAPDRESTDQGGSTESLSATDADVGTREHLTGAQTTTRSRTSAVPAAPDSADPADSASPTRPLAGETWYRAVDLDGLPLAELALRTPSGLELRTDDRGECIVAADDVPTPLGAALAAIGSGFLDEPDGRRLVVVFASAINVSGVVLDVAGAPLPGARVEVYTQLAALPDWPLALQDGDGSRSWRAQAGARGRFTLEQVPSFPGLAISAWRAGLSEDRQPMPDSDADNLRFVLSAELPQGASATLSGRVLDATGAPVAGAKVDYGWESTRSARDGTFRLRPEAGDVLLQPSPPLTAWKRGLRPAARRVSTADLDESLHARDLVLVLADEPLVIRGQVVDPRGKPLPGFWVTLQDGTQHGSSGIPLELETSGVGGLGVDADDEGRFELPGLLDRDYRVLAIDDDMRVVIATVRAGTHDLRLEIPDDALAEQLSGVVVDADGVPVGGAQVELSVTLVENGIGGVAQSGAGTRTDTQGRFSMKRVPWRNLDLVVRHDEVEYEPHPLTGRDPARDLTLVVRRRYLLRVEPRTGERATHYAILDAADREMTVAFTLHDLQGSRPRVPVLDQGRPVNADVSAGARTLVLFEGETELRRMPLVLRAGERNVVRP